MRHQFLGRLIPVRPEECTSYNTAVCLSILLSAATLICSALEVILFKVYNRKVKDILRFRNLTFNMLC